VESILRAVKGGAALRVVGSANAATFAPDLASALADIRSAGVTSLRANATEHIAKGNGTQRAGRWNIENVEHLLWIAS
jgi:hypothetical protein